MVQSNHMKLKKICPAHYILFINSVKLFEISQKKATFWKNAIAIFFNILQKIGDTTTQFVDFPAFKIMTSSLGTFFPPQSNFFFSQKNKKKFSPWRFFQKVALFAPPQVAKMSVTNAKINSLNVMYYFFKARLLLKFHYRGRVGWGGASA